MKIREGIIIMLETSHFMRNHNGKILNLSIKLYLVLSTIRRIVKT